MKLLVFILLIIPAISFTQIQDTTCFTNTQVQRIAMTMDSLNKTVEKQIEIIDEQTTVIKMQETVNVQSEMLLKMRANEVELLNGALDHALGLNTKITMKEKWYDSKYMYYIYGALTIYGGALVVSLVR
jgi:hypothetical protein